MRCPTGAADDDWLHKHGSAAEPKQERMEDMILDALSFVGCGIYKNQSPDLLLQEMDRHGVAKTLIAPVEEQITVYNQEGNRYIQTICEQNPERFAGYAVANPWYGAQAVDTLRSALQAGMAAVYFDSSIQGFIICDEIVYPLIDLCAEFDVPVYFHTGTPAFALPMQLHCLAQRYPTVNFIMGHAGANDFVADAIPALYKRDNIWIDTSMTLAVTQHSLLEAAPDRIVFSSASPRSDLLHELNKTRSVCTDEKLLDNVFCGNLQQVFRRGIR